MDQNGDFLQLRDFYHASHASTALHRHDAMKLYPAVLVRFRRFGKKALICLD